MTTPIDRRTPEGIRIFLKRQTEVALGADNRWFAGEKLGHSPTDSEAMRHFIEQGGAERFAQDFAEQQKGSSP